MLWWPLGRSGSPGLTAALAVGRMLGDPALLPDTVGPQPHVVCLASPTPDRREPSISAARMDGIRNAAIRD